MALAGKEEEKKDFHYRTEERRWKKAEINSNQLQKGRWPLETSEVGYLFKNLSDFRPIVAAHK